MYGALTLGFGALSGAMMGHFLLGDTPEEARPSTHPYWTGSPLRQGLWRMIHWSAWQVRTLNYPRLDGAIEARLREAGYPVGLDVPFFKGVMAFTGISMALLTQWAALMTTRQLLPGLLPFALLLGATFAYLVLADAGQRRMTEVGRALPYLLDLLAMSMGAGLDFTSSLTRVLEQGGAGEVLGAELRRMLQDLSMGRTRRDALLGLKARLPSVYIQDLIAAVLQAEQMGSPLAQVLGIQARAIRVKRNQQATRLAGELPVKLLLPLTFFVGAVILTVLGPLVIQLSAQGFAAP